MDNCRGDKMNLFFCKNAILPTLLQVKWHISTLFDKEPMFVYWKSFTILGYYTYFYYICEV